MTGGLSYTIAFKVSIGGVPNVFTARVTGGPGSSFYKLLAASLDTPFERNYTVPVTIPANVSDVILSFAGEGVRDLDEL